MTDIGVGIVAFPVDHSAAARRRRLMNPAGGRHSSELDIASGAELKRRRAQILQQQEEIKQAEADFRRQLKIDDLIREELRLHEKAKAIASKILVEETTGPKPPMIRAILALVSEQYGVPIVDLLSHRRTSTVILPRQIVMYLARAMTFRSLPEIGRMIGGRDHTTVMNAVKRVNERIDKSEKFAAKIRAFKDALSKV